MTTINQIVALSNERQTLLWKPIRTSGELQRLADIGVALSALWAQRRMELAQRHGVSDDTTPQAKTRWT